MHAIGCSIAPDHLQIFILTAGMEAQPQPETIRQRHLFFHCLAGGDRRRTLILDHVAWHQVAAVRRGIKQHIFWPPFNATIQHGFQRFVMLVIMAERQIIAEQDELIGCGAQMAQQALHRWQILARQFDDLQIVAFLAHRRMDRLHKAGFPHAARAPKQRIVCRQAARKMPGVFQQRIARPVHPDQQTDIHPRHPC
ncbi:MAG: hypothetical protein ACD_54C00763G0001, partial [uncultured bacterium]